MNPARIKYFESRIEELNRLCNDFVYLLNQEKSDSDLNISTPHGKLGILAVEIAKSEIGIKELTGKNDGPRIREYQEHIASLENQAWCCSFVSWCFLQAANKLNIKRPFSHHASVLAFYQMSKKNNWFLLDADVRSGDLFLQMNADKTVGKHIGFVLGVSGNRFSTVEGNLANAVGSISRNIKDYTFVRVKV